MSAQAPKRSNVRSTAEALTRTFGRSRARSDAHALTRSRVRPYRKSFRPTPSAPILGGVAPKAKTNGTTEARRRRPSTTAIPQSPITSFADWDRVWQIKTVLADFSASNGYAAAALLADAMLQDDRIAGVTATRVGSLVSTPVECKGANERRKAMKIAEQMGGSDKEPGLWDQIFPLATIADLSFWGNMLGIAVAEIVWRTENDAWTPQLHLWHPQHIRWDWRRGVYYLQTMSGAVDLPKVDENPRSDGKWLIWTPFGHRNGWRRAFLRPLAMLYLCRQWAHRDWSRYNEKHGSPADIVKVPEGAPDEEKTAFRDAISSRGSDSTIILPQGGQGEPGYDMSILEATARSWDSFEKFIGKLEVDIAVLILGQNLSTEVKEGSFAAAAVQENVRQDKRREDAAIAQCLRTQVLTWWAQYNHGDPELAPRVKYLVDPPEDEAAEVQVLKGVGEAISALTTAGVAVDVNAMADHYGVPLVTQEEIEKMTTEPEPKDEEEPEPKATDAEAEEIEKTIAEEEEAEIEGLSIRPKNETDEKA
jgi:phage gp29-like protein